MGTSVAHYPLSILREKGEEAFLQEMKEYETDEPIVATVGTNFTLEGLRPTINSYNRNKEHSDSNQIWFAKEMEDGGVILASHMGITVYKKVTK